MSKLERPENQTMEVGMKAHLAKLSLTLLSAVFLLGCQDMGSGAVGPDGLVPEFDKPVKSVGDCLALGRVLDEETGHCHADDDPAGVDPGTLFSRPGGFEAATGYTCGGGAAIIPDDPTFGTVNFNQPRDHSHIHANVQLRGAPQGNYNIFGNQELMCLEEPTDTDNTFVDFFLRPNHDRTVSVGANGKGKARIGLDFGGPDDRLGPDSHLDGPHKLWVTLVGISGAATNLILRSTFDVVVIPVHEGH